MKKEIIEEKKVTEIITPKAKKIREAIIETMNRPLFMQKHIFNKAKIMFQYDVKLIIETDEKISIMHKTYCANMGQYGLYIKAFGNYSGATYNKKGRSSSRLQIWRGGNFNKFDIVKELCEHINPGNKYLLEDTLLSKISTKGMQAYIIAGNITNKTQAMEYYIRYSMRGIGIDVKLADELYNFLNYAQHQYDGKMILAASKDPNEVLKRFGATLILEPDDLLLSAIKQEWAYLANLATGTCSKIDWFKLEFNIDDEINKLRKKEKTIEGLVSLWSDGPTISSKQTTSWSNQMLHL